MTYMPNLNDFQIGWWRQKAAPAELFKLGDKVQVCHGGQDWRDAVIIQFAGYGGGYYYVYDPLPEDGVDGIKPSTGGWTCDTFCRQRR